MSSMEKWQRSGDRTPVLEGEVDERRERHQVHLVVGRVLVEHLVERKHVLPSANTRVANQQKTRVFRNKEWNRLSPVRVPARGAV